jgi:outer membrane protein assembly factor BamB
MMMNRGAFPRSLVPILACFLLQSLAAFTCGADWPIFRGNPKQTGVAQDKLPDKLEKIWEFTAKDGVECAAAIVAGVVYVGCYDQFLYALDLATGKEKWRYKGAPFKAPPSVFRGSVYIGDTDGVFHCIDAATGVKKWTYDTGAEITSGANFAGDTVLFGAGDEMLYCLQDGKEKWKFKVPGGPVMGSPAIVGKRTFAAGCDSNLHVIDLDTGKEAAKPLELNGQIGSSVAVVGDRLYVGTMGNQVLAISWNIAEPKIDWAFEAAQKPQPYYSSAAVTNDVVVIGSRDRLVHALDRNTGAEIWNFTTRGRVDSSPVVADARIYVGSVDGNLYVLDLAKGAELQKFRLGGQITAAPAVSNGRLVIANQEGLIVCLGAK